MPLLFLAALMFAALARAEQPGRPDIVIFLADDLTAARTSARRSSPPWPPRA